MIEYRHIAPVCSADNGQSKAHWDFRSAIQSSGVDMDVIEISTKNMISGEIRSSDLSQLEKIIVQKELGLFPEYEFSPIYP